MIKNLHDGTPARFLVNEELSDPQEMVSGIRQGCPLAPFLAILAAEVLALAIAQDKSTTGLDVPETEEDKHKFSVSGGSEATAIHYRHRRTVWEALGPASAPHQG
jgi:hypothetical protein